MRRGIVLGVLLAVGGLSLAVSGFQAPPAGAGQGRGEGRGRGPQGPNVAEIEKVNDRLYMITGGGGNTAAFITDNGVVLVDTKLAGWGQAIMDKVKSVTNKPITTIINTHTHGDHNGSNEFFGTTVEYVAHENTKANMEKMDAFKGDKSAFIPKKTYKDKLSLGKGNDQIDLYYFGRAHTNGDAWVVFRSLRVMHSGDAFAGKTTPIIDPNNGGSAVDYGKTIAKASSSIKNVDTIITGHSPRMTPADLKEYASFNNDFVAWVQGEIKAGKSVDAAAADYKIPDQYKGYAVSTFLGGIKNNIQVAYTELGKK
jgi:cyclase